MDMSIHDPFVRDSGRLEACGQRGEENPLKAHHQVVLVVVDHEDAFLGELYLYERKSFLEPWHACSEGIPVVLGRKGLAWGKGIHDHLPYLPDLRELPCKKEGDGRAPAGAFLLTQSFGCEPKTPFSFPYVSLTPTMEAVDDPSSQYYNQIVRREEIKDPDWVSSEKMAKEPLYSWGIVVEHNYPHPIPGEGSAIFMHIWKGANVPTAGCTAMSVEHLETVLHFLRLEENPILVQLPKAVYLLVQKAWGLPLVSLAD